MNPVIKNILAVIIGAIAGGALNMGIIQISGSLIPPPEGVDVTTAEGLQAGIHLFEPKHFLMPFLAHALGTLIGALIGAKIAATHHMRIAIGIGCWNLLGGIAAAFMIPAPLWFILVDLIFAYLPMAYLGGKWSEKKTVNAI